MLSSLLSFLTILELLVFCLNSSSSYKSYFYELSKREKKKSKVCSEQHISLLV